MALWLDADPITQLRSSGPPWGAPDFIRALTEAAQPGARVVAALRAQQPDLTGLWRADLEREFKLLGQIARAATEAQGGLVMESKSERERVAAIVAAMSIPIWVKQRIKPLFETHYKRVADLTHTLLNRYELDVTLRDKAAAGLLELGGKRVGLLDIAGETKDALFSVIEEGRAQGLNPRETAKYIERYVPRGRFVRAGSHYRAQLIARTEALHAQRISSLELYRGSPVVKEVVAFDGEDDEECAARNGQTFSFDDAELEAEETHPNCVLAFGPVT